MKKRLRKRKKIRDDDDPRGAQMRYTFAAFKREVLKTLRERLPREIYGTLPEWAKMKEEPTT